MPDNQRYLERFQRVIRYIQQHLDEPLDMNQLADIAHLSPAHWHRIYSAICGETLNSTVRRLRLHRAAGHLINTDTAIAEIAQQCGYRSVQSFNRAFSESYGMPPARFRREGSHTRFQLTPCNKESAQMDSNNMDVRIECFEKPLALVGVAHTGSYMEIGTAFEKLHGWMFAQQIGPDLKAVIGIYHDDPSAVPVEQLRSHACAALKEGSQVQVPADFEQITIEPGRFAVLRYKGPYAGLSKAYEWFFGQWLAHSGEEMDERSCFEDYLNNPRDTPPEELLTDIYLPVR